MGEEWDVFICVYIFGMVYRHVPIAGEIRGEVIMVVRENEICKTPKLMSQNHRISNDPVGKAQSDITEIPYSSLVKNYILQKALETTTGQE